MKLKWKVTEKATGPYASFQHRTWPKASLPGDRHAFSIRCLHEYTPARGRGEQPHAPLKVLVADYRNAGPKNGAWMSRTLKGEFATLKEAKAAAEAFASKHPEVFIPWKDMP